MFIKDILHYLVPPDQQAPKLAPSLSPPKRGIGTDSTSNGANGVNGVNGSYHANGSNGANATSHTNGANGVNGAHHTNGLNGVNGDHSNGVNGNHTNGINGTKAPFPFQTEAEPGNPTIIPKALLDKFHFTFLIRDPHSSIPSYYRCTIPPLDDVTGFYEFYPSEAGYDELRRFFDYARGVGLVQQKEPVMEDGADDANGSNGQTETPEVCLIDADDLLDDPEGILRAYCKSVGLEFHPEMMNWDTEEDQQHAKEVFEKWKGFHEDAIYSNDLKPRKHVSEYLFPSPNSANLIQKKAAKTEEQWDAEWREKYGEKAAKVIRKTVDQNMPDYLHLKQFAIKA